MTKADDLGTVLGITGDDEAARLISNLTLPQMIKVFFFLLSIPFCYVYYFIDLYLDDHYSCRGLYPVIFYAL